MSNGLVMAIRKCKECNQEISNKAKSCPSCGAPSPKKTSLFTWFVVILIATSSYSYYSERVSMTPEEIAKEKLEKERERDLELAEEAAEQKERAAFLAAKAKAEAKKSALDKIAGIHYLTAFGGRSFGHWSLFEFVKNNLREPDSFEHVATKIAPKDENGEHIVTMRYRARNGFGGMNIEDISARMSNETCQLKEIIK